jgi:hypothetical protein
MGILTLWHKHAIAGKDKFLPVLNKHNFLIISSCDVQRHCAMLPNDTAMLPNDTVQCCHAQHAEIFGK